MILYLPIQPRILITRADRIGDLVLSTSIFPEIRKKYPKAFLACLTFVENREIVEGNPYLDQTILYDKKGREKSLWGQILFAQKMAGMKFDVVIHLHATNRMHVMTWLAGIPVRIGWSRRAAWALTHSFFDIKKEGEKHEAEYNFELLKPLRVAVPSKLETYFPVSDKAKKSLEGLLQHLGIPSDLPWVVLSPGASCASKRWPAERFGYAAEQLQKKIPAVFLVIGSRQDRKLAKKIQANSSAPIFDLTGRLSLGMLGILFQKAALLISNDSGPVHIASAVHTPVISIFGRNQRGLSPTRWRPLGDHSKFIWKNIGCDPCLAHECQINFLCLEVISVQEVVEEAEKIVERAFPHSLGGGEPRLKHSGMTQGPP